MYYQIAITPHHAGFGAYQASESNGEGWVDIHDLLAESGDCIELGVDQLPSGVEDIRGRIDYRGTDPLRVFALTEPDGEVVYFGIVQRPGYTDQHGTFFGRINERGNVDVLHIEDGLAATQLDAAVWPIGSSVSARYEHPAGIELELADAEKLGLDIER